MTNKSFYEWLVELSKNENFKATTLLSDDKYSEQYNLELIVRFLVFYFQKWDTITSADISDIGNFLDNEIVAIAQNNTFNQTETTLIFTKTFKYINDALEGDAFRKYYPSEKKHKGGFSIALFESICIGISCNIDFISNNYIKSKLKKKIKALSTNDYFNSSSGSGIRGNTRVTKTIPHAIKLFAT